LAAGARAIKIEWRQRGRAYITTAFHKVDCRESLVVTAAATMSIDATTPGRQSFDAPNQPH